MKVIFLDIDGVLNFYGSDFLDKNCLNNLKYIVNETNAKIVIISTWRVCLDDNYLKKYVTKANSELLKYRELFENTFTDNLKWIDIAPDLAERRSEEVTLWLKDHPETENFVIIDDFNCEYDKNYPENWIRPSYYLKGLTKELAKKSIKILNNG